MPLITNWAVSGLPVRGRDIHALDEARPCGPEPSVPGARAAGRDSIRPVVWLVGRAGSPGNRGRVSRGAGADGCLPLRVLELPPALREPTTGTDPGAESDRVEDRSHGRGPRVAGRRLRCLLHRALFTAWRLADRCRSRPALLRPVSGGRNGVEPRPARHGSHCSRATPACAARWPDRPRVLDDAAWRVASGLGRLAAKGDCFGLCLMDGQRGEARSDGPAVPTDLRRR